jgi:hypothetical protein
MGEYFARHWRSRIQLMRKQYCDPLESYVRVRYIMIANIKLYINEIIRYCIFLRIFREPVSPIPPESVSWLFLAALIYGNTSTRWWCRCQSSFFILFFCRQTAVHYYKKNRVEISTILDRIRSKLLLLQEVWLNNSLWYLFMNWTFITNECQCPHKTSPHLKDKLRYMSNFVA